MRMDGKLGSKNCLKGLAFLKAPLNLSEAQQTHLQIILATLQFPEALFLPSKESSAQILCPLSFFHLLPQELPSVRDLAGEHVPAKYVFNRCLCLEKENVATCQKWEGEAQRKIASHVAYLLSL